MLCLRAEGKLASPPPGTDAETAEVDEHDGASDRLEYSPSALRLDRFAAAAVGWGRGLFVERRLGRGGVSRCRDESGLCRDHEQQQG